MTPAIYIDGFQIMLLIVAGVLIAVTAVSARRVREQRLERDTQRQFRRAQTMLPAERIRFAYEGIAADAERIFDQWLDNMPPGGYRYRGNMPIRRHERP